MGLYPLHTPPLPSRMNASAAPRAQAARAQELLTQLIYGLTNLATSIEDFDASVEADSVPLLSDQM